VNHAVVTEHLADYLEGDLALDLRALVDAHLDGCEACKREVREMQQTIRLLRALPEPEVPPMIAANVMRRIRAGETRPSFLERIQRSFGGVLEPSFVLPASALAVAALVLFVIRDPVSVRPAFAPSAVEEAPTAPSRSSSEGDGAASRMLAAAEPMEAIVFDDSSTGARAPQQPRATGRSEATRPREERFAAVAEPRAPAIPFAPSASGAMTSAPWTSPRLARGRVEEGRGAGRGYFGDPALAQGFASTVSGPATAGPSRGISGDRTVGLPLAAAPRVGVGSTAIESSGGQMGGQMAGEDPRDVWLARALDQPAEFAQYIARHNLAEQELWVTRLADRARARGLLTELISALRRAGDEKASWLADDFSAQAAATDAGSPSEPSDVRPAEVDR